MFKGLVFTCILIFAPISAQAGDGATILFREGHVAYVNNGYTTLVENYKKLNKDSRSHEIVELKIESSPFFINLSEVVIICRDHCSSLEVSDPRRSRTRSEQE